MTPSSLPATLDLKSIVESLSTRVSFTAGKQLLNNFMLPINLGWERTIDGLGQVDQSKPAMITAMSKLKESFYHHTIIGEKIVRQYGIDGLGTPFKSAFLAAVRKAKSTITIPSSPFLQKYPLAVFDADELAALDGNDPVLTAIAQFSDTMAFTFCSVRAFKERVEIDVNELNATAQAGLNGFSEVFGVRATWRQCYDVVVVDMNTGRIEARVDAPDGVSSDQQRSAIQKLNEVFDLLATTHFGHSPFGAGPFNFHKLLNNLYKKAGEGRVFQLGFTASTSKTSSNNGARLVRKKGLDIRLDDFHVGGKKAVHEIDVYTIGVVWNGAQFYAEPKLVVPGGISMLYKSPVLFPEVIVRDCMTLSDYAFVADKIAQYRV